MSISAPAMKTGTARWRCAFRRCWRRFCNPEGCFWPTGPLRFLIALISRSTGTCRKADTSCIDARECRQWSPAEQAGIVGRFKRNRRCEKIVLAEISDLGFVDARAYLAPEAR